jgi:hypothetical protein
MAYISTEQVASIRKQIKSSFPGYKISIKRENYSKVNIDILQAPIELRWDANREHVTVNNYWIEDTYKHMPDAMAVLKKILDIANAGNFDHSDISTDYHHVGHYVDLSIGNWEKPFVVVAK